MALQREISNALSYATSNGYQVHPDAFAMLKGLDTNILKIVQDIIKIKIKQKEKSLIIVEDIKKYILGDKIKVMNVNISGVKASSATYTSSFSEENHHKVIMDPTSKVNSGEGVEGYTALFRSRLEKSLRILALRPESKRITKIASIRQKANNSKTNKSYSREFNGKFIFHCSWLAYVQAFKEKWNRDND